MFRVMDAESFFVDYQNLVTSSCLKVNGQARLLLSRFSKQNNGKFKIQKFKQNEKNSQKKQNTFSYLRT